MIVWLASYPRCGNTLLRQVLKCCFGRDSWENADTAADPSPEFQKQYADSKRIWEYWGNRNTTGDFHTFYARATRSAEVVFVKTHEAPSDDQDAIYVVRDGRLALDSFVAFQDHYHPGTSTFASLLCGDHAYGSWSDHYRSWQERPRGRTHVVRFEELVNAGPELLASLAKFIGHTGPIRPWVNAQARLREAMPAFFRDGRVEWTPAPHWNDFAIRMFFSLHGETMTDLGYATRDEVDRHAFPPGTVEAQLARLIRDLVARTWALQRECDARLGVIHRLEEARQGAYKVRKAA